MTDFYTPGSGEVQLSAEQIQSRILELGEQLTQEYADLKPHLICVLNGAWLFHADLVRSIKLPLSVDFMAVSSYGSGKTSSGEVRLTKDLSLPLADRHVILVEDIVDTGITMHYLLSYLQGRMPASLKVAALLNKPSRRRIEVPVHYCGFTIPDAYVYGYGLDRDQFDRNLPFISSVES